ncbi:hypothetical protein L2E82_22977 [Cichorium intybus]|uniref:Uncharacterized protein n=1 Tax=Cichorium intybus TaxID=13427 RepID=A0ACB9E0A0_CICIN|nr:hypothetical protein L2E82_22977 [Cichorium intybus]
MARRMTRSGDFVGIQRRYSLGIATVVFAAVYGANFGGKYDLGDQSGFDLLVKHISKQIKGKPNYINENIITGF